MFMSRVAYQGILPLRVCVWGGGGGEGSSMNAATPTPTSYLTTCHLHTCIIKITIKTKQISNALSCRLYFCIFFLDPLIEIPITWPKGTYALPRPTTGCPDSYSTWHSGYRIHDLEGNNHWSSVNHFYPVPTNSGHHVQQSFCCKTEAELDKLAWTFLPGQYCLVKKGNCPSGE